MKKEVVEKDIERLSEWALMQPHFPKGIDGRVLSSFVHGSKSLEIAKQKLEAFLTRRALLSRTMPFFNMRDPTSEDFLKNCKSGKLFFLPKTTPEGYKVLFCNITEDFGENYDQQQTTAHFQMTLELSCVLWPDMKGLVIVWDLDGFKPSYAAKVSFPVVEATIRYFQDCYPIKMKRTVYINTPPIVETAYNTIFKAFLNEKIKKRLILTREDSSFLKTFLPEEILPMDYGGKEKHTSELNSEWLKLLQEKKDWIQSYSQLVADESKRPPDTKQTIGVDGTFRTLDID